MRIPAFRCERYFARHEFNAPWLLCSSDAESMTCDELLELEPEYCGRLGKLRLGYTETAGSPELREEIAGMYESVSRDDIIVLSGAEEGIFLYMNAMLGEGDHVIVQFPAYQSLFEIASAIGCDVTRWIMQEKEKWELPLDFLEKNIRKNTRLIVINTPHNPTGSLLPLSAYGRLIEIARRKDISIFSDEVYRLLEYEPGSRLVAMCDLYEKGVSLGVMSKVFGLAGLRIGWIVIKEENTRRKVAAMRDYTTICNSAPSELLSIIALRHREHILAGNMAIVSGNLSLLRDFFNRCGNLFSWIPPEAGTIAFPKILGERSAEAFCRDLLEKKGTLLLPGSIYDYDDRHFRLGFGRRNMPQALSLLEEYVRETG